MKPVQMIKTNRRIQGIAAVLVPFDGEGRIDWPGFEAHLQRIVDVGLIPAVNMDTGYVNWLTGRQRQSVLERTAAGLGTRPWVAGAFVADDPGDAFDLAAYCQEIQWIEERGGTPIIFQSFGLTAGSDQEILARYREMAEVCQRFMAFELGTMFAPFGRIYSSALFAELLQIPQCQGLKHSSLDRVPEWLRLQIRDRQRPDFRLYTGNDLAIDMVMYGSDYLLGLATMAPAAFARRDEYWQAGDLRFYALNDALQNLGWFAFRRPVPAYRHSAAMVLEMRGWIGRDGTHPDCPRRPETDRDVLRDILRNIDDALGLE
jgi:dihydrodipicolinate synthase/N-acetylneuraminate lyase